MASSIPIDRRRKRRLEYAGRKLIVVVGLAFGSFGRDSYGEHTVPPLRWDTLPPKSKTVIPNSINRIVLKSDWNAATSCYGRFYLNGRELWLSVDTVSPDTWAKSTSSEVFTIPAKDCCKGKCCTRQAPCRQWRSYKQILSKYFYLPDSGYDVELAEGGACSYIIDNLDGIVQVSAAQTEMSLVNPTQPLLDEEPSDTSLGVDMQIGSYVSGNSLYAFDGVAGLGLSKRSLVTSPRLASWFKNFTFQFSSNFNTGSFLHIGQELSFFPIEDRGITWIHVPVTKVDGAFKDWAMEVMQISIGRETMYLGPGSDSYGLGHDDTIEPMLPRRDKVRLIAKISSSIPFISLPFEMYAILQRYISTSNECGICEELGNSREFFYMYACETVYQLPTLKLTIRNPTDPTGLVTFSIPPKAYTQTGLCREHPSHHLITAYPIRCNMSSTNVTADGTANCAIELGISFMRDFPFLHFDTGERPGPDEESEETPTISFGCSNMTVSKWENITTKTCHIDGSGAPTVLDTAKVIEISTSLLIDLVDINLVPQSMTSTVWYVAQHGLLVIGLYTLISALVISFLYVKPCVANRLARRKVVEATGECSPNSVNREEQSNL